MGKSQKVRALTLVEVMLSLVIVGIGVLSGVELMARIVRADAQQTSLGRWESQIMLARQTINDTPVTDIQSAIADGKTWVIPTANVSVRSGSTAGLPYLSTSLPLTLQILDSTGAILTEVPMVRTISTL